MRKYKNCYIAVIDLLGFKNALENNDCETIASIFDELAKKYMAIYRREQI